MNVETPPVPYAIGLRSTLFCRCNGTPDHEPGTCCCCGVLLQDCSYGGRGLRDTRTKREIATELVDQLFSETPRIVIADALAVAEAHGVSKSTFGKVVAEKGIKTIRNGRSAGFWERRS